MIETCTHCGAVNREHAEKCCSCNQPLARSEFPALVVGRPAPTEGNLALEANWRSEVASRLEAYRTRHRRPKAGDAQPALPFSVERTGANINAAAPSQAERESKEIIADTAEMEPDHAHDPAGSANAEAARHGRAGRIERVEIEVEQPELDFSGLAAHSSRWPRGAHGGGRALPVAELAERGRAGLMDAVLMVLAYAGFLALFRSLGGHFTFAKLDALVFAVTLALVYTQYFALFNVFGGTTPGMKLRGLRVVSFGGGKPTWRQLAWRSLGYVFSAGAICLGFFWALWDEDHLTWQDRISQTYLTRVERIEESVPASAHL